VLPGQPARRYAALAARLRRAGLALALAQSESVAGITWRTLATSDLAEGPDALLALGAPTDRGELASAREDVAVLAEHGRRAGLSGAVGVEDHLLEVIVGRSPRLVERMRERILGSMAGGDRAELTRTLQTLLALDLDRTATSATLHVHRNTLAYRLRRIEETSGLDLSRPRDVACAYVAMRAESDRQER
jgi:sugar diacid utilization regulator